MQSKDPERPVDILTDLLFDAGKTSRSFKETRNPGADDVHSSCHSRRWKQRADRGVLGVHGEAPNTSADCKGPQFEELKEALDLATNLTAPGKVVVEV